MLGSRRDSEPRPGRPSQDTAVAAAPEASEAAWPSAVPEKNAGPRRAKLLKRVQRREARRSRGPGCSPGARLRCDARVLFDNWVRTTPRNVSRLGVLRQEAPRETIADPAPRSSRERPVRSVESGTGRRVWARFDPVTALARLCRGTRRGRDAPRAHASPPPITAGAPRRPGFPGQCRLFWAGQPRAAIWSAARGARSPAGASAIGVPAWALSADGAEGPRRASPRRYRNLRSKLAHANRVANRSGPSRREPRGPNVLNPRATDGAPISGSGSQ